jgi:hypothetical protein
MLASSMISSSGANDVTDAKHHPASLTPGRLRGSQTVLKANLIAPRDIIEPIPEPLLHYLHEDLDHSRFRLLRQPDPRLLQLEEVLMDRLFPLGDGRSFVAALRRHSRATAVASRVIAEAAGLPPDTTYVAGWIHDLGVASCLRHADEVMLIAEPAAFANLWPTIERSSASHAIRLCTRWRLPSSIRYAVRDHMTFDTLTRPSIVAAATIIAEQIANHLGFAFGRRCGLESPEIRRACVRLELSEWRLPNLAHQTAIRLR